MELSYKPDLADAQEHWRAFWNHDIIDTHGDPGLGRIGEPKIL